MLKKYILNIILLSQPLLFAGVMSGILHFGHILLICIISMFLLSREEAAVTLTLVMPPAIGKITSLYAPIPGSVICLLLATIILNNRIFTIIKPEDKRSLKYIIILTVMFIFWYIVSGMGEYANIKMSELFINIPLGCFNFYILKHESKIDTSKIALMFGLYAIFLMSLAYDLFGYIKPDGLFDFISYREYTMELKRAGLPFLSYHMPAMFASSAIAYLLSSKNRLTTIYLITISTYFWLVLVCGARQGLVSIVIIVFLWFILKDQKIKIKSIIMAIGTILIFYYILIALDVETIQVMFDSDATLGDSFNRDIDYPVSVIKSLPIFGVGFGNYMNPYSGEWYPHNMIFEIIIELGILGFMLLAILLISFGKSNKFNIKKRLPNGALAIVLFTPLLTRALISSHIGANIIVFIAFFILFQADGTTAKHYKGKITI